MSYKVRLPIFEGPFDLLVYLIEDARMNIYDIRISEITGQYIEYINVMKDLNVALSTKFMVLAAELLRIKSRMMLPRSEAEGVTPDEVDPRSELVRQLIEYKMAKAQSEILKDQEEHMLNIFSKPQEDISYYRDHPDEYLSLSEADFTRAFKAFLRRKEKIAETMQRYTLLERERRTMEEKMNYITVTLDHALGAGAEKINFLEFVKDEKDTEDVVVSFLSVLQLARDRFIDVEQSSLYGDIMVSRAKGV